MLQFGEVKSLLHHGRCEMRFPPDIGRRLSNRYEREQEVLNWCKECAEGIRGFFGLHTNSEKRSIYFSASVNNPDELRQILGFQTKVLPMKHHLRITDQRCSAGG